MIRVVIEFDPATGQIKDIKGPSNLLLANLILDKAKQVVMAQPIKLQVEGVAVPSPELANRLLESNGR